MQSLKNWKNELFLVFLLCLSAMTSIYADVSNTMLVKARYSHLSLNMKIFALLSKVEVEQKWRNEMQDLFEKMKKYTISEDGKISARHLDTMRKSIAYYTGTIVPSIDQYRSSQIDFLNPDNIILIDDKKPTIVDFKFSRLIPIKELRSLRHHRRHFRKIVTRVIINPHDKKGQKLFSDLLFQVSARVQALENISLGLIPFINVGHFRFALVRDLKNTATDTIEEQWHNYINTLYKSDTLIDLITFLKKNHDSIVQAHPVNATLFSLINSSTIGSFINQRVDQFTFFKDMLANMRFKAKLHWDTYRQIGENVLYEASKIFGNSVGMVQFRRGKLYHMSLEEENRIAAKMKPLDVMFEKTPFRLTDRFIPGFFGHNAIWAGNEEQLKALGVWDKLPDLFMSAIEKYGYKGKSFQADIRDGARIIEALRSGVEINSLRHFLDIDDFAVMRAQDCDEWRKGETFCLTPELKKEYLLKAFSQLGKAYDFAFDVNTEETIVCSELLYRTYLDIDFKTSYVIGSYNISPDQVAYQGDEEGDIFTPFILYHDGKEITKDIRSFFYDLLHTDKLIKLREEALIN